MATWARELASHGQNFSGSAEQLSVIPAAYDESMFGAWTVRAVSTNPTGSAAGRPNARSSKVAICARVTSISGQYLSGSSVHPSVTFRSARRST